MGCVSGCFSQNGVKQIIIPCFIPKSRESSLCEGSKLAQYKGLLDTGATSSVLSKKIVDDLQLLPYAKKPVATAAGEVLSDVYSITLIIGLGYHAIPFPSLSVTTFPGTGTFDMLIGMDVISKGHLSLSHAGWWTFSL